MDLGQMDDYMAAICHAQDANPQARIRAGLECEFIHDQRSFYYREVLLGEYALDYLILGHALLSGGQPVGGWFSHPE